MLEFKYLGCVLDESGTDETECLMRGLQLEYTRVLHETLLMPVLMYGSETMIWKESDSSRIRVVQMNNLRDFLGIRRMDEVLSAECTDNGVVRSD